MPKTIGNPVFASHIKQPRHMGPIKTPELYSKSTVIENDETKTIEIFAKTDKQTIQFIQFVTDASPETIGCLSFLCAQLEKKPVAEIDNWTPKLLAQELGLPDKKSTPAQHAFDAVWKCLHGDDLLSEAFSSIKKYNDFYPTGGQYQSED